MPMEHVNRRGDRYCIFQGKTKTGRPKYYASKKATSDSGVPVDTLPDDFEVFENPSNSTVTVRRCKPSRVLPAERDFVQRLTLELSGCSSVQTILDGDRIVIYTPDRDPAVTAEVFGRIFGSSPVGLDQWTQRFTNYTAELRFTLKDADRRLYTAQRYCYRGSIDRWINIGRPAPLEPLVRKFAPHLGQESFFELF